MKFLRTASVLVLAVFAAAACDDDDDATGLVVSDLSGNWNVTQFEYTDNGNTAFSVDVITDLGGTVTLNVASDGSFTGTIEVPAAQTGQVPMAGTFTISGGTLNIDFTGQASMAGLVSDIAAAYTLSGNTLTLTNDDVNYDFPDSIEIGAGIGARGEVSATVDITLVR
ncbi:MAG: hypothetical protein ACN0LA_01765 [Candidatus Longimicrobiales bacterium M2_2A_002]